MFQERFSFLVTRQLTGAITAAEEKELAELLLQPEYAAQFRSIKRFWEQKEPVGNPDVEKALHTVMEQMKRPQQPLLRSRSRIHKRIKIALAICITGLIAWGAGWYMVSGKQTAMADATNVGVNAMANTSNFLEKYNTRGTRSVITLADGTKVWLNADSKLKYPPGFTGKQREVELVGEAFFDVVKNKQKPFIIHVKNAVVKVLGTSFNIKAYENEAVVETSVVTGRVAFIPVKDNRLIKDTTFLTPNMKAVYGVETGSLITQAANGEEDKAWTEGRLIFKDLFFKDIAATLERNFGKEVVFNSEALMQYRLTGGFENNTLEEILYYLSQSKPFTYRITETQIILSAIE